MALLCMHCLEEGDWTDEDKCPRCAQRGHTSPWEVGSCPACNQEYLDKMAEIAGRVQLRQRYNAVIAQLQARVTKLEETVTRLQGTVATLDSRLRATGSERIGGCLS